MIWMDATFLLEFATSYFNLFGNGKDSFHLFDGIFDTCLVWYLLMLPSQTHVMTSLRAIDGVTKYH